MDAKQLMEKVAFNKMMKSAYQAGFEDGMSKEATRRTATSLPGRVAPKTIQVGGAPNQAAQFNLGGGKVTALPFENVTKGVGGEPSRIVNQHGTVTIMPNQTAAQRKQHNPTLQDKVVGFAGDHKTGLAATGGAGTVLGLLSYLLSGKKDTPVDVLEAPAGAPISDIVEAPPQEDKESRIAAIKDYLVTRRAGVMAGGTALGAGVGMALDDKNKLRGGLIGGGLGLAGSYGALKGYDALKA